MDLDAVVEDCDFVDHNVVVEPDSTSVAHINGQGAAALRHFQHQVESVLAALGQAQVHFGLVVVVVDRDVAAQRLVDLVRVVGARGVEVEAGHQLEVVVKVLGAEDLVGVLHEQHAAFAQEERQSVGEGDVVDVSGAGLVELAAVEIVPVDSREVDVAASLALFEDRRSHQVVADEEVGLGDVVDVVVVVERVDQEERVVDRAESPSPDED